MNKRIITAVTAFSLCAAFSSAQKLSFTNQFGADSDGLTNHDIYYYSREDQPDGTISDINGFDIGDRLQLDYSSSILSGRFRFETEYNDENGDGNLIINPEGYVHFTPVKQFGIVAGNNVFKKFSIPSAYLAAQDDYTKYGRLLTDSLSIDEEYIDTGSFMIPNQILIGGITSDWTFGRKNNIYLKAAAGSNFAFSPSFAWSLDGGINFGIKKVADFGFTAHDITSGNRKFGAFAGLKMFDNAVLNGSFYYNFSGSDFSPEYGVEKTDDDDNDYYGFKKQKTEYALGITGGYFFQKIQLGVYADFISGLTSTYIGKIKYVDKSGNESESYQVIERGSTIVKYKEKTGYTKQTTDYFPAGAVPFYTQLRVDYGITENISAACNVKLRALFNSGDSDCTWITVYPRFSIKLPSDIGSISAGVRIDMNAARCQSVKNGGISGISVPFTYTYKNSKDFSKKSKN